MHYLLPPEIQLDIFKYLNFNQLLSFQQTNSYFKNFIGKYEKDLARMCLYEIEIVIYILNFIDFNSSFRLILMRTMQINTNYLNQKQKFMAFNWVNYSRKRLKIYTVESNSVRQR